METMAQEGEANAHVPFLRLPADILDLILSRIDLRDHLRLGATCRLLQDHVSNENPPLSKSILQVPARHHHLLLRRYLVPSPLPSVQQDLPKAEEHKFRCVGSFEGWLVVYERGIANGNLSVMHRILRLRIGLAWLRSFFFRVQKVVLSADPRSDECVAAVWYDQNCVAICGVARGGTWVKVSLPPYATVTDLALHKNMLWVSTTAKDLRLLKWKLDNGPPLSATSPESFGAPSLQYSGEFLLVRFGGKLLVVVWSGRDVFRVLDTDSGFAEKGDLDGGVLLVRIQWRCHGRHLVDVFADEMGILGWKDCIHVHTDVRTFVFMYCAKTGRFRMRQRNVFLR